MNKSRLYLYIVAGGYLAYTGFGLIKNVMAEQPEHSVIYIAIGAVFIIVGGFFAIKSLLNISKGDNSENDDDNDNDKTEGE